MHRITDFIEKQSFGVCKAIGDRVGFSSSSVRLSFVYASFFTFGSPIVLYFALAFWRNVRHAMRQQRSTVWDL
ncbi:PspC domain-containing protein [Hymenobacter sp. ISL-91]|uniref:PspC domain-containing protein n=2 Tax=Hymenobacter TaxID=89966 RepID=A0A7Y7U4T0_9BACT|nr:MULTISPECIES: PspC domain-containing protein [Hymenobacter]MBT2558515.1 PspC domain-containing protein [Hymenobacter sp. ISL-91]NVO29999.1 PspC domain-containing protein [Hymenobacter lapidiphilus]NVO85903.1 PspC domain-containing protein [Hymenobacter terrestris]